MTIKIDESSNDPFAALFKCKDLKMSEIERMHIELVNTLTSAIHLFSSKTGIIISNLKIVEVGYNKDGFAEGLVIPEYSINPGIFKRE